MKTVLSALAIVLLAVAPVLAADTSAVIEQAVQSTQERKAQAVARYIVLEGDVKASFDATYAEFQEELGAVNEKYAGLVWRLLEQAKVPSIEDAKKVMREFRDLEVKKLDLRDQYFEKFGAVLDPTQFVRLMQIENKAEAILKYTVALEIPVME